MATIYWIGNNSSQWHAANNWSSNSVPGVNDDVVLQFTPQSRWLPILSQSTSIRKLSIAASYNGNSLHVVGCRLTVRTLLINQGVLNISMDEAGSELLLSGGEDSYVCTGGMFVSTNGGGGVRMVEGSKLTIERTSFRISTRFVVDGENTVLSIGNFKDGLNYVELTPGNNLLIGKSAVLRILPGLNGSYAIKQVAAKEADTIGASQIVVVGGTIEYDGTPGLSRTIGVYTQVQARGKLDIGKNHTGANLVFHHAGKDARGNIDIKGLLEIIESSTINISGGCSLKVTSSLGLFVNSASVVDLRMSTITPAPNDTPAVINCTNLVVEEGCLVDIGIQRLLVNDVVVAARLYSLVVEGNVSLLGEVTTVSLANDAVMESIPLGFNRHTTLKVSGNLLLSNLSSKMEITESPNDHAGNIITPVIYGGLKTGDWFYISDRLLATKWNAEDKTFSGVTTIPPPD